MTKIRVFILLAACLTVSDYPISAQEGKPLTLDEIITLHNSNLGDSVIMAHVRACGMERKLTTDDLIKLKKAGFTDPLIAFLIDQAAQGFHSSEPKPQSTQEMPAVSAHEAPVSKIQDVANLTPEQLTAQCEYLKKIEEINKRYEKQDQSSLDSLKLAFDPATIDIMRGNRQLQLHDISALEAPIHLTDFQRDICSFLTDEIQIYMNLGLALAGDTSAAASTKEAALALLARGRAVYERHNSLRKQCGLQELPSLSLFGI